MYSALSNVEANEQCLARRARALEAQHASRLLCSLPSACHHRPQGKLQGASTSLAYCVQSYRDLHSGSTAPDLPGCVSG